MERDHGVWRSGVVCRDAVVVGGGDGRSRLVARRATAEILLGDAAERVRCRASSCVDGGADEACVVGLDGEDAGCRDEVLELVEIEPAAP